MELLPIIAQERRAVADLLDTLSEEQLRTPSLVPTWRVKDVAAHLVLGLDLPFLRMLLTLLVTRSMDKTTDKLTFELGRRPIRELTDLLRNKAESRMAPPGYGLEVPLTEILVHELDLRRPLGDAWAPNADVARVVLDFLVKPSAAGFARPGWRKDLRFEVTDFNWSHGAGPCLRGRSDAVLLAITGRMAGLDNLQGDGVGILRDRFTTCLKA